MDQQLTPIPIVRDTVDQNFLLEPLGGPRDVFYYLGRFPDEIYHKSPDTILYKFMRAMLGENGVNWLKKNYLEARLLLEALGIDLFDLDQFYGNAFQFGRIAEESFDDDPYGLIPKDQWEQIKAKNARYRNRALDFISGARAGNTPYGMRLVAKSGLGYDTEIVENYKYFYDIHSDDPLGIPYMGKSTSTEEMIVRPRPELSDGDLFDIPEADKHHLQEAVDRVRPWTTVMTLMPARGIRQRRDWNSLHASSEYTEVIRYVTGNPNVNWPQSTLDTQTLWIQSRVENEAPRVGDDLQHHYTGFHNINSVVASSEERTINGVISADRALADYAEPLFITSATELGNGKMESFVNGVYPTEYMNLPGSPRVTYRANQFWSSVAQTGEDDLTVNFKDIKAINYIAFDIAKVPVQINVEYDAYDEDTQLFVPVIPVEPYSNTITQSASTGESPWASLGLTFTNTKGDLIFTRSLKIRFTRLGDYEGSVQVKNLRVARNV